MSIRIATASWNIRSEFRDNFLSEGSHLERYASRFNAVEINSSFYKTHRKKTYERWAASVPDDFRFAAKMPKEITHTKMLVEVSSELETFINGVAGLGNKLGVVLVQLPPKLRFQPSVARNFFHLFRTVWPGAVVCEPRHPSWFEGGSESVFMDYNISRVKADPSIGPADSVPASSAETIYYRWHGSPEVYYSSYSEAQLLGLSQSAKDASRSGRRVWCVFDNTARGAATSNALTLLTMLGSNFQSKECQ